MPLKPSPLPFSPLPLHHVPTGTRRRLIHSGQAPPERASRVDAEPARGLLPRARAGVADLLEHHHDAP